MNNTIYLLSFALLTWCILNLYKFPFEERLFEVKEHIDRNVQTGIFFYQINVSNCLITIEDQTWTILVSEGLLYVYAGQNDERCSNSDFGYLLNRKDGSLINKCLIPLKKVRAIFADGRRLNIIPFPKNWNNHNLIDLVNYLMIEKKCLLLE